MAADQTAIDEWFIDKGVPRFLARYEPSRAIPLAATMLGVLLAFEITTQPHDESQWQSWIGDPGPDDGWQGALEDWAPFAAPALVVLALGSFVPFVRVLNRRRKGAGNDRGDWWHLVVAALIPIGVAFLLESSPLPHPWMRPWIELAIVLAGGFGVAFLLRHSSWVVWDTRCRALRLLLAVGLTAGVLLYAEEVHDIARSPEGGWRDRLALAAVVAATLLAFALRRLGRASLTAQRPAPSAPSRLHVYVVAVLGLFTLQTGVLPVIRYDDVEDGVLALVVLGVLVACLAISYLPHVDARVRAVARGAWDAVGPRLKGNAAITTALAFLVVYPAFAWRDAGSEALLEALAMNAAYLAVTALVVAFGLHHVADWAAMQMILRLKSVIVAVGRGVPLLAVATVVLFLTGEVWQVANGVETAQFVLLPAVLLGLALMFVVVGGWDDVSKACDFKDEEAVTDAIAGADRPPADAAVRALRDAATGSSTQSFPTCLSLTTLQRLNVIAILLVYQALVLAAVFVATYFAFRWLGHELMSVQVLDGFGVQPPRGRYTTATLPDRIFAHVALLLASLAVLSVATQAGSSSEQQDTFYAGALAGVRQRLAVLLLYRNAF